MESFCPVKIKQCVRNSIISSGLSYTTGRVALHVSTDTSSAQEVISVCLIAAFILLQCWISMKTIRSARFLRDRYAGAVDPRIYNLSLNLLEPFCLCSNSLFTGYLAGLFGRLIYQWSRLVYIHILLGNYLVLAAFIIFYVIPERVLLKNPRICITVVLSTHILCYIIFTEEYHLFLECDSSLFYFENIALQLCITVGVFVLLACYFTEYETDQESATKHWELCLKFVFIPLRLICIFSVDVVRGFLGEWFPSLSRIKIQHF